MRAQEHPGRVGLSHVELRTVEKLAEMLHREEVIWTYGGKGLTWTGSRRATKILAKRIEFVLDHHNGHRKPEEQTVVHLIQSLPDLPMGLKEPLALCSSPHLPLCDL
jgi:hypothetical protein